MAKYKNKDGISLNCTGKDVHIKLVKEVIVSAITMLEDARVADTIVFLKENFDIIEINDLMEGFREDV